MKLLYIRFFNEDNSTLTVKFVDNGIPFNPLEEKNSKYNFRF
ncbi:hypothetical protein [Methanobrevibacter arboriphilus]|nr:hypothetical protein [Methanobrevibacter arboriphilus]